MSGILGRRTGLIFVTISFFTLLGACASVPPIKGLVSEVSDISMTKFEVEDGTDIGKRFSHALREELRHEFSRSRGQGSATKIHLEVRELTYRDKSQAIFFMGQNRMNSHVVLRDIDSGEPVGEFDIVVLSHENGMNADDKADRGRIRVSLIKLTVQQTVRKIYGYGRALRIEDNDATHDREPYRVPVLRPIFPKFYAPIENGEMTDTAMGKIPKAVIMEAVENPTKVPEPAVIKAPVLPVQ